MATDVSPEVPDDEMKVAGIRLADIVERPNSFGSLFVGPGSGLRARAQIAIDAVPVPAPQAGQLLASVEDTQSRSQVVIADGEAVWRFLLDDPLAADLARFGETPSLGPIIEAAQVTTPHVVVTVENDVFGITSFGTVDSAPVLQGGEAPELPSPAILEALDHLVDAIRSSGARLIALMGTEAAIEDVQRHVQAALPFARCNPYPTDDIDRDLLEIADEVVKDAASLAAEHRTHELAQFRQLRTAAQTREGEEVLDAIKAGSAQRLLVHDDLVADQDRGSVRLVDRAIVAAIRKNVPITMIPNVPDDRGPKNGLGVIVQGHGTAVPASAASPEGTDQVELLA